MMWNPPWSLAVVLPLGLFPAREAQLLWLAVNFAAIFFCGDRLWLLLGGARERRWVGWAIALAVLPTLFALQSGQIGPLLLLGAVLFLECERRGWHFAAGAATVLLAIKPHLAYLVWVAILFDAVARGRWRIVLGGAVAGLVCCGCCRSHSTRMSGSSTPTRSATARRRSGCRRRSARCCGWRSAGAAFGLQFVPVAVGLAWFAWHWRSTTKEWNWREQLPLLLLVSFVTAPYGAWPFDMVLLLPAAMWLVLRAGTAVRVGPSIAGLIAVNVGCLVLNLLKISSFWFLWVSPAVLLLYVVGTRTRTPIANATGSPVPNAPEAVPV